MKVVRIFLKIDLKNTHVCINNFISTYLPKKRYNFFPILKQSDTYQSISAQFEYGLFESSFLR